MRRKRPTIENKAKVAQSCTTLCDPMDYTVHGILQARVLEWVAISFSRGSPQTRARTRVCYVYLHWQAGSLPLVPPGKPSRIMCVLSCSVMSDSLQPHEL